MDFHLSSPNVFEFHKNELWLLFSFFSPVNIIGMKDPNIGILTNEIELLTNSALTSLMERELVFPGKDGAIQLDFSLYYLVKTIAHPDHTLIVQQGFPVTEPAQRFIHFADDMIVEHVELEDGNHRITAIKDRPALMDTFDIDGTGQEKPSGKPFNISEDVFLRAAAEFANREPVTGQEILKNESSLSVGAIEALSDALGNTRLNCSFVILKNQGNRETQHVAGFGVLESENNSFLLQPLDQNGQVTIHFQPANHAVLHKRLMEILP